MDVICLVHTGKTQKLQQQMNTVVPTHSIVFTREDGENNGMPFLDTKFTRKEDGSVKSTVYRKKTHIDQYLNFASHHPKHQKLGVVMNRCEMILMALWMVVNHLELKVYITADMLNEADEMTIEAYMYKVM